MTTPLTTHRNLVTLVQLLRKMERSSVPVDPDQYRSVIAQIQAGLRDHPHDTALESLLAAMPELAELHENLNYEHAGLCRSPLEASVQSEQLARAALEKARRHA